MSKPLWQPSAEQVANANLTSFIRRLNSRYEADADGYESLYRWSIAQPAQFWTALAQYAGVRLSGELEPAVIGLNRMAPPDPQHGPYWFPNAKLNFARELLWPAGERAPEGSDPAIIAWNENGRCSWLTWDELRYRVLTLRRWLRDEAGVTVGDRVAGFMPNIPESIIAMLAATSLGALWSSCSPDFGVQGVLDRFGQIAPKVLFTADGYQYNGKRIDSLARARELLPQLSSIQHVVVVEYMEHEPGLNDLGNVEYLKKIFSSEGQESKVESRKSKETKGSDSEKAADELAEELGIGRIDLTETVTDETLARSVGAALIWKHKALPVSMDGRNLVLAMIDPLDLTAIDAVREATKLDVIPMVTSACEFDAVYERIFGGSDVESRKSNELVGGFDGLTIAEQMESLAGPDSTSSDFRLSTFDFNHPLYIMYSSGTTGLPKCMVHGAGGTLLQHLKELLLHTDLKPGERIFYFSTCGWMMWNWQLSALACGATLVLYDGSPFAPHKDILWDMASEEKLNVFGTSAKYIALLEKEGVKPAQSHELPELRCICSTGSPLAPESFDYVYRDVKADVQLASISGGTDIISCFALGNPLGPVYRGELQCRGLGMAVDVYDESGGPVRGEPGELVCTMPFPSMPVSFWNDPDGSKYRGAYFEQYPGAWRHGDWVELTDHGDKAPAGLIIHGRSDATLNPGGVRIGTAEIYRQVEQLSEVVESLVVGQDFEGDTRIVLFVRLQQGRQLDDELRTRICQQIRANTSPHHVPKRIVQVRDIPRTISGKIVELAVREVIHGRPVKNVDALANPDALEEYRDREELRD